MPADPENLDLARELAERDPIFGQILILYEKQAHGKRDNRLADFVLTSMSTNMSERVVKFYEDKLLDEHGLTRQKYERAWAAISREVEKHDYNIDAREATDNLMDRGKWPYPVDIDQLEEIENVAESLGEFISELDHAVASPDFEVKINALDRAMYNYHAGIAPMEMFDATREELENFAEFLATADREQLASLTRRMEAPEEEERRPPAFLPPSPIEGFMPSGRPIRFGDRRPVAVRRHVRRRHR